MGSNASNSAIVLVALTSRVSDSDLDQIDPKLKSHVTSLIINKFEKDLYDTNAILRGVKLLVDWFDNIKNLKLNFTYTDPCRDNYILLNFHDRVLHNPDLFDNYLYHSCLVTNFLTQRVIISTRKGLSFHINAFFNAKFHFSDPNY